MRTLFGTRAGDFYFQMVFIMGLFLQIHFRRGGGNCFLLGRNVT